MKQLTGLDASFLYMETPTTYGHVNGLAIYERPTPDFDPYAAVYERFGSMVGHVEPLRRRVVEVPFGLDHPYWVDDPHFDLDFHVRQIGLAPPGAADQLAEQVARIIGRRMDRTHPLWEVYVIEGLGDGRWAMLTKFHHATVDGAAGVIMLKMFTDESADAPWPFEPIAWTPDPLPADSELLKHTVGNLVANPVKATRLSLRVVRNMAEAAGLTTLGGVVARSRELIASRAGRSEEAEAVADQIRRVTLPVTPAPPTPWNKSVGPHRRFAMRSTALSNIKQLKDATGGTVNDVVMAICAGALREYLVQRDALPTAPLRAMVPVSIRTGLEEDPWTNRVSSIVAELPTDCDDPVERVARCRAAMDVAKHQLELVPATALTEATDATSPVVAGAAVRLMARLSDRVNLPVNVVISNVPGPREPLYFAGCKLDHYIPVSTISNGVGLNITVHSYEDRLDFGLVADRDLVPDLWDLVDLHVDEIARLFEASGAEWAEPQAKPAGRRGAMPKVEPAPKKSAAKKSSPKKSTAKKSSAKKSTAKKSTAKKSSPKKSTAKKSSAKKSSAKKK
ncbi:MAG: wax ester/triacylglycerol synthase family O-acyltransferase [Ilumatobacteraceae bacterium]|nr:wax ester/triacylglycerol synthase family O-acyltransferase [Ilumatobacteraceae bacterium]